MPHSIVAPSSSARRVQCSMSTTAEARFPDADREDAAQGEAAHWGLAELLAGHVIAPGLIAPNGLFLTDEMMEAAEVMHDDIVRTLAPFNLTPLDGAIEKALRIPRVHPESFGTPDYRVWAPSAATPASPLTLRVWDFKYGHRYVDAYENWQGIEYVAGCLDEAGVDGLMDQVINVVFTIVQPRSYHRDGPVRRWSFRASDIRAHINRASNAAHEALGPNPVARTGPECRDCRARHACPTFQRAGYNAVDESSREQPHELPPAALAIELAIVDEALDRLKARREGLMQQGLSLVKAGQKLPGWALEHGAGRTRWAKPDAAIISLGRMAGVDLAKPPEVVTPKQAVERGFPLDRFGTDLVETPRAAATLVRDDGSRAARVFGAVSTVST